MLIEILIFLAGIATLTFGAHMLVDHSSKIAAHFNIRPFIIGATVIAFGTSAPELIVSLSATLKGTKSIALGNVLGSNIANIGLILGVTSLISTTSVQDSVIKKEVPIMITALVVLYLLSIDGLISRLDGFVLFSGIVMFTLYCIRSHNSSKKENNDSPKIIRENHFGKNIALSIVGLLFLVGGAHFMVDSAVSIARAMGMTELFIGITMVAVGTSLPEFAASTAAIVQKKSDMSIGNIVGSNIFNVLLVLGLIPMINPIPVDKSLLSFEYPVMIVFAVLLYILGKRGKKFTRLDGAILLILYCIFIAILYVKGT